MPLNPKTLRNWFLALAVIVVAVVIGFYIHARNRVREAIKEIPQKKLGIEIQQSTQGFSLSKSEGGRTLFTIRAAKAVQYKTGGRAELEKVDIIVYGKEANRFDQIYGDKFVYDPDTGDVSAQGDVHIDLEANLQGPANPDQAQPAELKNPIHFKTSNLVFNQKTGFAATNEKVEFRIPQASGSAVGATYDSKANVLTLQSAVMVRTPGAQGATIVAQHAEVTKEPRQAVLQVVKLTQPGRTLQSDKVTIDFRDDNSVEKILATGDVSGSTEGANALNFHSGAADIAMGQKSAQSAVLYGGVTVASAAVDGSADKVQVAFGPNSQVQKITALGNAHFMQKQSGQNQQPFELAADGVDFSIGDSNRLERAVTRGAAQITTVQNGEPTVITAGQFTADFDAQNHLKSVHGEPDVKVVARQAAGQPDRVATSRTIDATFTTKSGLSTLVQAGDFHYTEGQQSATAERARYTAADQVLTLTGSPRVSDAQVTTTASQFRLLRKTGDAVADGDVKTTYTDVQAQPSGALLGGSQPIHVTSKSMTAKHAAGTARYVGGARLWQGANIVEAPTIEFSRGQRSLLAIGTGPADVKSVFVQQDSSGKVTPVSVTAARLTYADGDRKARFDGGVVLRGADGTITADHVDVFLHPRTAQSAQGPSQVDRVVAQDNVVIQQQGRRATGSQLTYYAAEQKFVLTGGPPVIVDPQHGSTTGDSLTFYSRDDRVVVGSAANSRTVTQTKVQR